MTKPLGTYDPARAALSPSRRVELLERLRSAASPAVAAGSPEIDVIVIGAGVTGAGIALDAATRGLSVLLVDKVDLAFGTSRWSSKLAHGGLRYLASGNVGIARRSAVERGVLMEVTAPHLTRALGQVVPVNRKFSLLNRVLPRLGFLAGDVLRIAAGTSSRTLPRSRTISARRIAELCPAVDRDGLLFGYLNYDGQLLDDAALVTALARTAAGFGADVLTHATASRVDAAADGSGSKVVLDVDGEELSLRAACVVNATGVWAGGLDEGVTVTPSRGTHLVIDAAKVGNPTGALTVPVPGATNRFCFILPSQLGRCYIGITDEPAPLEDVPKAPPADVDWILDVVNQALATKLTRADVLGAFAGLRPLVQLKGAGAGPESTADLSREHAIIERAGMITVTGGKLTEYRLMAEQTVDAVLRKAPSLREKAGECITKSVPLVGAPSRPDNRDTAPCLVERGSEAVVPGLDVTRAQLSFAVTHEGARTVSDIVDRRTRLGLVPEHRAAAEPVAREVLAAAGIED